MRSHEYDMMIDRRIARDRIALDFVSNGFRDFEINDIREDDATWNISYTNWANKSGLSKVGNFEEYVSFLESRSNLIARLKSSLNSEDYQRIKQPDFDSSENRLNRAKFHIKELDRLENASKVIRAENYDVAIVPVGAFFSSYNFDSILQKDINLNIRSIAENEHKLSENYTKLGVDNVFKEYSNGTKIVIPLIAAYTSWDDKSIRDIFEERLGKSPYDTWYGDSDETFIALDRLGNSMGYRFLKDPGQENIQREFEEIRNNIVESKNGNDALKKILKHHINNGDNDMMYNLNECFSSRMGVGIESIVGNGAKLTLPRYKRSY